MNPPYPEPYAPAKLTDHKGQSDLAEACPMIDPNDLLCCGADTAAILKANFAALDAAFLDDCNICAVDLKRMWCEYACNQYKGEFSKCLQTEFL